MSRAIARVTLLPNKNGAIPRYPLSNMLNAPEKKKPKHIKKYAPKTNGSVDKIFNPVDLLHMRFPSMIRKYPTTPKIREIKAWANICSLPYKWYL
ncbi:hypothetical protein [Paenibacillus phage SV21]|nr:hypothetical protein [Paenibacillus phage SV21]